MVTREGFTPRLVEHSSDSRTRARKNVEMPAGTEETARDRTPMLRLQQVAGNQAVLQLLGVADSRVAPAQRAPVADTSSAVAKDTEGNEIDTTGERPHLKAIPAGVTWHKGKPQALPPNPLATFAALHAQCEAIREQQLATAERLKGDMKYWFAKVYYFVTMHELLQIDAGIYQYPLMKMQEVIAFQATYETNLQAWESGNKDKVESNWRAAFAAAEDASAWYRTKAYEIGMYALLPSMQAHIRFDLPRAIASCYDSNYAGIPDLSVADFHADFDAMQPVFDAAQADLQPEIDKAATWVSPHLRGDPSNWHWAQSLGFPLKFDVPQEREHTWEKASDIVSGHRNGITGQQDMQKRLKAYTTGRHPLSGGSDYEVNGNEIEDYDWNNQPK
jgi:uncharacterized protein DUF5995